MYTIHTISNSYDTYYTRQATRVVINCPKDRDVVCAMCYMCAIDSYVYVRTLYILLHT